MKNKQARLVFQNSHSIPYFLLYVVTAKTFKDKARDERYLQMMQDIITNKNLLFFQNDTFSTSYKLLKSLEDASNEIGIDDREKFFNKTLINFDNFQHSAPNNPLFNKDDLVFGRLKRAFKFEWNTFKKPHEKYTQEEINEYFANKPYITFAHYAHRVIMVVVGSVLVTTLFNYLDSKK